MGISKIAAKGELSNEQLDAIQQFEADYNSIDSFLRTSLACEKHISFSRLLSDYSRKYPNWRDADLLRTVAYLRNAIVHGKTEPYGYVAVPTSAIAAELKHCRERLTNPLRAIPAFQRMVETIATDSSLTSVLKLIQERDYSQFPVYEDSCFRGLLTENGITRWLANHVATQLSLVDLDDVPVTNVLRDEAVRNNVQFARGETPVGDVSALFAQQPLLEAVLITATGKQTEKLQGIATRWDILHVA